MAAHPRISAALRHCVRCGRHTRECGALSARGRCRSCGAGAVVENAHQLRDHQGPYWDRYVRAVVTALTAS